MICNKNVCVLFYFLYQLLGEDGLLLFCFLRQILGRLVAVEVCSRLYHLRASNQRKVMSSTSSTRSINGGGHGHSRSSSSLLDAVSTRTPLAHTNGHRVEC